MGSRSDAETHRIGSGTNRGSGSSSPAAPPISIWPSQRGSRDSPRCGLLHLADGKGQSVRDAAHRGRRVLRWGLVLGALVVEGSLGRNSGKEFRRAPSRTGTLTPHRAAVSASSKGDPSPLPHTTEGGAASHLNPFTAAGSQHPDARSSPIGPRSIVATSRAKNDLERRSGDKLSGRGNRRAAAALTTRRRRRINHLKNDGPNASSWTGPNRPIGRGQPLAGRCGVDMTGPRFRPPGAFSTPRIHLELRRRS
jgi:hypothetical protein